MRQARAKYRQSIQRRESTLSLLQIFCPWTKSFRPRNYGKQRLPGATIGVDWCFLVRMSHSIGLTGATWKSLSPPPESGSIARAAERCRLAPSAASKRLSDLRPRWRAAGAAQPWRAPHRRRTGPVAAFARPAGRSPAHRAGGAQLWRRSERPYVRLFMPIFRRLSNTCRRRWRSSPKPGRAFVWNWKNMCPARWRRRWRKTSPMWRGQRPERL